MKKQWTKIKSIIQTHEQQKELFLSVINDEGTIVSANAFMVKTLDLKSPKKEKVNIFDLIHPANVSDFKTILQKSTGETSPACMEVYIKNGLYHPMKWQISHLPGADGVSAYFCVGHKILDDERLKKFNELGEKNYQLIVEGLNAGILFQDKKGELIAANQKAADVFDSTLEKLYQLTGIENLWNTVWEIKTENDRKVSFADTPFMKALKSGKPEAEVLVIRLGSGEQRWFHFSSQPLFEDNNPVPYSVVSNIADLTPERKLAEELYERKILFRAFMNQTPNIAWVVDEDSILLLANQAFFQYFRLEEKKAVNKNITELVPPAVAKALYEKHIQVLQTGLPADMVQKVKLADGTDMVFHINLFPITGAGGKKLLGGHAVNLEDKYAAEKKLREVNDRLLLLTRATTDAIWEWDMQTGYIFRNDALMDMIGYHLDDPKGLSWWLRRIHPEDRNRISDKVKDSTDRNKQSWEDEYRFKCADGHYKHMRDKGYIVYENGLPVKMIGSLQDVTSLKDLEGQLMEEKLQKQKEISETVIRVQEMERTRIGHELHDNVNQILSTTKLFVDMLTPANKDERKIKEKSIEYILMAVEEIRKLSKELVVPQLKDKGLVESIWSLVDDINLSTSLKIKFTHDLENGLLTPGIQVTLFRIVQEQFKNIIKHSRAKKVDITLQSREAEIHLMIRDDGAGFDSSKTTRGIGLSNIFERTRFYNGVSEIQTSPGKGCMLNITIPYLQ